VLDFLLPALSIAPGVLAGMVGGGALAVGLLTALVRRRPQALAYLVFAALPFRVPLSLGGDTVNLLVPLYVVIAAGVLAHAPRWWRTRHARPAADRMVHRLDRVLVVVLVLYVVQAAYTTDLGQAAKNVCFFYLPFAALYRLLRELDWSRSLLLRCGGLVVALALVFAAVGVVEFATGRLLIANAKVLHANEIKPYFRVNSLFFDPNIYGRFLAVTMIGLATALVFTRRTRAVVLIAIVLGLLWGGLVLSLSQSSFAALFVGLAVLAAVRWRPAPVAAAVAVAVAAGVAVVLLAPSVVGLQTHSGRDLDQATSGRTDLVRGGARMARDRPIWGFGSGSFSERFRAREQIHSERVAAASHTIPVTVAAEQGAVGLLAYVALLWAAFTLVLAGVRARVQAGPPDVSAVAQTAIAAAFTALVLHTWVYAAFLEDPLTWALLGLAVALRLGTGSPPAAAALASSP
jgi:O-antigen ligase